MCCSDLWVRYDEGRREAHYPLCPSLSTSIRLHPPSEYISSPPSLDAECGHCVVKVQGRKMQRAGRAPTPLPSTISIVSRAGFWNHGMVRALSLRGPRISLQLVRLASGNEQHSPDRTDHALLLALFFCGHGMLSFGCLDAVEDVGNRRKVLEQHLKAVRVPLSSCTVSVKPTQHFHCALLV